MASYALVQPGLGVDPTIVPPVWVTYTPQIMVAGGGTAPTYTSVAGSFLVQQGVVFCDVDLSNTAGGTAGAGAGQLSISLPILPAAWVPPDMISLGGYSLNNATYGRIMGTLTAGSVWMGISRWSSSTALVILAGTDQNNATRTIRAHFWYQTDILPIG
jgi:hypothetical protein